MSDTLKNLAMLAHKTNDNEAFFADVEFGNLASSLGIVKITSRHFMRHASDDIATVLYSATKEPDAAFITDDVRCELGTDNVIVFKFYLTHDLTESSDKPLYDLFTSIICSRIENDYFKVNYEQSINYDPLTGIPNLNTFYDKLGLLFAENRQSDYSAGFLNIKQFSNFNRLFGSHTSNNVLKHYSLKVSEYFDPDKDELFARIGGDNYVFIALNDRLDELKALLSSVDLMIMSEEDTLACTISARIGLCRLEPSLTNPSDVMTAIASALKYSRIPGNPDIVVYTQDTQDRLLKRDNFMSEIKRAVDEHKFLVYYQPIIKVGDSDSVVGAEALLRWRRHDMMLTPGDFIPIAEEYGYIYKLDLYVLETVCSKLREWIDEGIRVVPISCNFSKHDLSEAGLPSSIVSIIDKYGIDHSLITIEFTEAGFHEEYESIYNTAKILRDEGIKVAIDNFGTGYSSLSLLRDLNFDYLKIDSSVGNSGNDKSDIIFANIVDMASKLGYTVICEGLENKERINRAIEAGCTTFQSEFYAKACSERFFLNMIKGRA